LIQAGASPENLFGVDLLPQRIEDARKKCPAGVSLACGDASHLNYSDDSFDFVFVMTVFSSILDASIRISLAREMLRVLRLGGSILWYDFHVNNPYNKDVSGIGKQEIHDLFPDCRRELHRITLAPPVARLVAQPSPVLYWLLSCVPVLCTHYLGWFT